MTTRDIQNSTRQSRTERCRDTNDTKTIKNLLVNVKFILDFEQSPLIVR